MKTQIEKEIQKLEKLNKANQIFLVGHTDADGDLDFNQSLSQKRVESVFNFFVENGVSKEKIDLEYYDKGLFVGFLPNTKEGESAYNEIVKVTGDIEDFHVPIGELIIKGQHQIFLRYAQQFPQKEGFKKV